MAVKTTSAKKPKVTAVKPVRAAIRKPALKLTQTKSKAKYPGMLGMTHFSRDASKNVVRSSEEKVELLFSTRDVPQIWFRPASEHKEEVDDVPESNVITATELRLGGMDYRSLVMIGIAFLVVSGKHKVIMDRHPHYPADNIRSFMRNYRKVAGTENQRLTRKYAFKASQRTEELLERHKEMMDFLARMHAEQITNDEKIIRNTLNIVGALDDAADAGSLSLECRQKLKDSAAELRTIVHGREKLRSAKELERYEVNSK